MTESYLDMLEESLDQKIQVLEEIEKENLVQKDILENEEGFDEESFDETLNRKSELIKRVESLNDGFETVFARVKEELDKNREKYKDRIHIYQDKIRRITDLSNSIEVGELRNRNLVATHVNKTRDQINTKRKSSKAALDYYLTMNKSKITPPQFYDTKN